MTEPASDETKADLTFDGNTGIPADGSPAEDSGIPADGSPEPDKVTAPEDGAGETGGTQAEGGEAEANPELLNKRMGDKDRHIRQQSDEIKELKMRVAYHEQQIAATQAPVTPPPFDQGESPTEANAKGMLIQVMRYQHQQYNRKYFEEHPEDAKPERVNALEKELALLGWNPQDVTAEKLAMYPTLLKKARKLAFFEEEKIKAKTESSKKAKETQAAAAKAKVGAGISDSAMGGAAPAASPGKPSSLRECGDFELNRLAD